MSPLNLPLLRMALAAGVLALALAACGRRGPLEPPVEAGYEASQKEAAQKREAQRQAAARTRRVATVEGDPTDDGDGDDEEADAPERVPYALPGQTNRRRSRAFTIPREPFILDPLL